MTKDEANASPKDAALRLALEALEAIHTQGDVACVVTPNGEIYIQPAIADIVVALEAKDEPADNELRRLHDLLGKANALARIRAAEIESLKASLYGHYELEKQYDELKQRLTKTEGQLGEAVWNYGELKREQLANQQKTSGSPINSLTEADKIRNACPRTYNRCGYDAVVKKCVAEGCAGPQNWAVFCGGCGKKWGVPYQHPGKSICAECEAKLHTTQPQRKPLTDEEIQQIFIANSVVVDNGNAYMVAGLRTVNIARAIEQAHGIKGEA